MDDLENLYGYLALETGNCLWEWCRHHGGCLMVIASFLFVVHIPALNGLSAQKAVRSELRNG